MRNLGGLGLRSLRERAARSWFAAFSVVLAVAVVFGVYAGTSTLTRDVARLHDDLSGWADVIAVPVGAHGSTLADGAAAAVEGRQGVAAVTGSYEFGGTIVLISGPDRIDEPSENMGTILVTGLEAGTAPEAARLVEGRWPRPGEIVLGSRTARELGAGVATGQTVRVQGGGEPHPATVVGIAESGVSLLNNGYTAVADLDWVRQVDGGAGFKRLFVSLDEGVAADRWIVENREALPGVELTAASDRSNTAWDFLSGVSPVLQGFSLLAVLIGGYVIYLSFSTAVAERRRTYGLLRAIGAAPRQVLGAVVAEAAVLGVVGTAVGLAIGVSAADVVITQMAALAGAAPPAVDVSFAALITAGALGVLGPVVSVLGPAIRAARTEPSVVMRDEPATRTVPKALWPIIVGMFLAGVAVIASDNTDLSGLGLVIVLLASALALPVLLTPAARLLRPLVRRVVPGIGDVAVQHLAREHSRSAYTAGLVMIVLAVALAMTTVFSSLRQTFAAARDSRLGADFEVHSYDGELAAPVLTQLRGLDVRGQTELASGTTTLVEPEGGRERLLAIEPATYFEIAGFSWVQGPGTAAVRERLAAGGGLLLPGIYANELGVSVGDPITLATTEGVEPFEVVATYAAIETGGYRSIVVNMKDGRDLFGIGDPHAVYVSLRDDQHPDPILAQLSSDLASEQGAYYVQDNAQIRDIMQMQFDSIAALFNGIIAIVAIVGVLGLANTLVVAVLARVHEAGVLRAIGVHRRQLTWLTSAEAVTLTLTGLLLAIPLGALLGWLLVRGLTTGLGTQMDYRYPWYVVPIGLLLALLFAGLASILPARRALRLDPVAALRFD